MALGKRRRERPLEAFVAASDLPRSPGHPFYAALNRLLAENGFASSGADFFRRDSRILPRKTLDSQDSDAKPSPSRRSVEGVSWAGVGQPPDGFPRGGSRSPVRGEPSSSHAVAVQALSSCRFARSPRRPSAWSPVPTHFARLIWAMGQLLAALVGCGAHRWQAFGS
jgi:hypothetical protein